MGNNDPVVEKTQKSIYTPLVIFIVIGVLGVIAWQAFFMAPPLEEVPEPRVPQINTDFLTGDYFQDLDYFEIISFPEDELIGRERPFYPWDEGEIDEEEEEEEVTEDLP